MDRGKLDIKVARSTKGNGRTGRSSRGNGGIEENAGESFVKDRIIFNLTKNDNFHRLLNHYF